MAALKIVIVTCKMDALGRPLPRIYPAESPHGCYHIVEIYGENYLQVATVAHNVEQEKVVAIAKILAGNSVVEVNSNFYEEWWR